LIIKDKDSFVLGMFAGAFILCILMLAVPKRLNCEVSVARVGSQVEVVRYGVVNIY
jgi:hypothetical protein